MRVPTSNSAIFVIYAALLILVLPLLMVDLEYKVPKGLPVYLAEPPKYCGDGKSLVVYALKDGSLKLNAESLKRDELANRLRDVFQTMAERLLVVKAGPDVPFQDVVQIIDIARTQANYVALLTPNIEKEVADHFCCCLTISHPRPTTPYH